MANQYPAVTLKLNIKKNYDKGLINKEFTKSFSSILISKLPQNKDFIDELILKIKKEM